MVILNWVLKLHTQTYAIQRHRQNALRSQKTRADHRIRLRQCI